MTTKSAIVILTQNTPEKRIYLKNCLYFLFKNFNEKFKYPVIILHEGDYTPEFQEEIIKGVRGESSSFIKFKELDKEDFKIPEHIDKVKLAKSIELQPVPYWRNESYRNMCNFWLKHFTKYVAEYDYVMRLDDDSIIEEKINSDLFQIMKEKDLNYISNIIHIDCGICNYEMKEFFDHYYMDKQDLIKDMFVYSKIDNNSKEIFDNFKKLYKIMNDKEYEKNEVDIKSPIMYYNNFFITKTAFWNTENTKKVIDEINKTGNIYYYRWGDAPLHTIIATIADKEKVSKCAFKYSKRLQRESFKDASGKIHSYMPGTYDNTSCITYKKPL
uniref:Uncharacterized protein n=1 Tax=viral metagenome TaxID=1070528 RepID=A0A6C0J4F2_9ZZZZ